MHAPIERHLIRLTLPWTEFLQEGRPPSAILQSRIDGSSKRVDGLRVGRMPTFFEEEIMGINKDQVAGRAKEAAGKIQEVGGRIARSTEQELKGKVNKNVGAAQAKFGDAKEHVKDAAKDHAKDVKDHQR